MTPKITTVILDITGGVVQSAVCDGPVRVVVLDYDVNEDPDNVNVWPIPQGSVIPPMPAWVCDPVLEVNPARIHEILSAAKARP